MSKMALNFFESYKWTVKFNFDNQDLTGVLSFNQSGIPHLKIHTDNHFLLFEERRVIQEPITCYEIGSNKTFILHQSELQRGASIICRFVTTGSSIPNGIDQIEVHLTGISTWFERLRSSEITERWCSKTCDDNFSKLYRKITTFFCFKQTRKMWRRGRFWYFLHIPMSGRHLKGRFHEKHSNGKNGLLERSGHWAGRRPVGKTEISK